MLVVVRVGHDAIDGVAGGSWSRDGVIVFGSPKGLYRVSAEGGKPELITAVEKQESGRPVLVGGYHGRWAPPGALTELTVSREDLSDRGLTLGAGVVLVNSEITGNTTTDVTLTFGTRFDSGVLQFVTYTCDSTVLVRGASGITCPH